MPADYCEMCDLPLSQCVHGMPAPVDPPKPTRAAPRSSDSRSGASRAPRSKPARSPTTTRRTAPRRWTQPVELRPFVLAVLQDAQGPLEQADVLARLEDRIGERLRAGDRDPNPRGELRWHAAARTARKELIDEGLLDRAGPGIWALTRAGELEPVPSE